MTYEVASFCVWPRIAVIREEKRREKEEGSGRHGKRFDVIQRMC